MTAPRTVASLLLAALLHALALGVCLRPAPAAGRAAPAAGVEHVALVASALSTTEEPRAEHARMPWGLAGAPAPLVAPASERELPAFSSVDATLPIRVAGLPQARAPPRA